MKQFHELNEEEVKELEESLKARAKAENRDLLSDVRCVYPDPNDIMKYAKDYEKGY